MWKNVYEKREREQFDEVTTKREKRVGEAPKLELIGEGRIAGTNGGSPAAQAPLRRRHIDSSGKRACKMAAGVPFLPCYSYGVGFRLSRSLCLRGV